MKNKKVVFVDVDQTLYDNRKQILYPSTIEAMRLLKENNIDVFLATGRSVNTINHLQEVLPYFKGLITNNGQTVFADDKIIFERPIDIHILKEFEAFANENNVPIAYVGDFNTSANFVTIVSNTAFTNFQIHNVEVLNKLPFHNNYSVKQFWVFEENTIIDTFKDKFENLEFINWPGKYGADGVLKGASKVDGIKAVINYYNYSKEHTYALGDGDNDISMFQEVEYSYCMGNGTEKAKNASKYVTDEISKDGFYKAVLDIIKK